MKPENHKSLPISKIAIYGKGGIGKSTISANISAALADEGFSILHIGCDPKHDSTRALLGELQQKTVTEYLRSSEGVIEYSELIRIGYGGIACIEAGGPEPGVGCAGRGILSTFEVLNRMGTDASQYSYTIYDVLGDVVCGGFAVPLRHGYADLIFIVTSGEYMSLYAANNILRGIRNFDGNIKRIGGIIYNSRGGANEDELVRKFSVAVNLPILVTIPRSEIFLTSERYSKTIIAAFPNAPESSLFRGLASHIIGNTNPVCRYQAFPLELDELESLIMGKKCQTPPAQTKKCPETIVPSQKGNTETVNSYPTDRPPLFGCAFAGVIAVLSQIHDAAVIAHGPSSCSHIVSNLLISAYNRDTQKMILDKNPLSFIQTSMDENTVIFGGLEKVRRATYTAAESGNRVIFIVSSCIPGITGDDITGCARDLTRELNLPVIPVPVDGVGEGDFSAGTIAGYKAAAELIKTDMKKGRRNVVIVGEKILANNISTNFYEIGQYLSCLNIDVVCRFLAKTTIHQIELIGDATLILPGSSDENTINLAGLISRKTGAEIFPYSFPCSFRSTVRWLKLLGDIVGSREIVCSLIEKNEAIYQKIIGEIKPVTSGRTVIVSSSGPDISWVLEILKDCEMEIICAGYFSSPYATKKNEISDDISILQDYTPDILYSDIQKYHPDLVLTTFWLDTEKADIRYGMIPFCPNVGFFGALSPMKQWSAILSGPIREGWRNDL